MEKGIFGTFDTFDQSGVPPDELTSGPSGSNLPALGVLPVEVQSLEAELFDELHGIGDELVPGRRIVDHAAVLVTLRVVPSAQCDQHSDALLLQTGNFLVKSRPVLVDIAPRVEHLHHQVAVVERGEAVDDVGAQVDVDVGRRVSSGARAVPRPVGVVTDDFLPS